MWELIFILLEYLFLLYVTFYYSKRILVAPSFSFVFCFIPQMILLLMYADKWSVDLSDGTFLIFVFGPILFWIGTIVVNCFFASTDTKRQLQCVQTQQQRCVDCKDVSTLVMILFLLFQTAVFFLTLNFLIKNIPGTSIANIIYTYRVASKAGGGELVIPGLLGSARTLCLAVGFYYSYFLANNIVNGIKKNTSLLYLILITGTVNSLLSGARTGVFQLIIALAVQLYFAHLNKNRLKFKIKIKSVLKYIIICILSFQLFMLSADLMGRNVTDKFSASDYLAIYLAAEAKNLDLFVKEGKFESDISNNQTFRSIINKLVNYMPNSHYLPDTRNWTNLLDNPFRSVNGYDLGNVSTVYYAPLYDYGYIGVILYIVFMGIFCEVFYLKAKKELQTRKGFVATIIYSYLYFVIVFSFFSPKFSEMIFNTEFIKMILLWKFLGWVHYTKSIGIRLKI